MALSNVYSVTIISIELLYPLIEYQYIVIYNIFVSSIISLKHWIRHMTVVDACLLIYNLIILDAFFFHG